MNSAKNIAVGFEWNQATVLIISILLFTAIAILLTLFTFYNRYTRQRRMRIKAAYQPIIEELVFAYLFDERTIDAVLNDPQFRMHFEKTLFKKIMLKNIITLHKQYSGEYQQKLEVLYGESGLIAYSEKKLRSRRWNVLVVAIRDLSEMNAHQHYPTIASLCKHANHLVQLEAITGLIRLRGPEALKVLEYYPERLNNWVQANIFHAIKPHTASDVPDFGFLLYNSNQTVVVLGLRLTGHYGQADHMPRIRELQQLHPEDYFQEAVRYAEAKLTPYL